METVPHKFRVYESVQIKTTDGNHLGAPSDAVKGEFGTIIELCVAEEPSPGTPANTSRPPLMYVVEIAGGGIELIGENWIWYDGIPD